VEDITHREIYDRLVEVESKVDKLDEKTDAVVNAFEAATGAFAVLEFLGKLAKPLLWIAGLSAAAVAAFENIKFR
jgi:hypothetical protein